MLYLEKREEPLDSLADDSEYRFAVELIEKVGWEAGNKKAAPTYKRNPEDGSLIIDDDGMPLIDCDFEDAINRIVASDASNYFEWLNRGKKTCENFVGWTVSIKDVYDDPDLTCDPKRYGKKVVSLRKQIMDGNFLRLGDIVDFFPEKQTKEGKKVTIKKSEIYSYVEIQDIGYGDFYSKEMRGWELPSRAKHFSEADDIYFGSIWGSAVKWCYIPQGQNNIVVTNGCFRCRVKEQMEKFTPDLLAYLNSEGWGVQMRSLARGSDGLAEICEQDAKNVLIPLLSDDIRSILSEHIENLKQGTPSINTKIKHLLRDGEIDYHEPNKRPSHIVLV